MNRANTAKKVALICSGAVFYGVLVANIASISIEESVKPCEYLPSSLIDEQSPPVHFSFEQLSVDIPVEGLVLTREERINLLVDNVCESYPAVNPSIIKSMIWHESRYDSNARNYNGTCVGLMQVSTKWHAGRAQRLGVSDFFDPYSNILLGVDYFNELIEKYSDPYLALMVYNMGDGKALKLYRQGKTTKYSRSVMDRANNLQIGGV